MKHFIPEKSLFVLIDPEKESDLEVWKSKVSLIKANPNISGILLGGSTLLNDFGNDIISKFRRETNKPIIGFPGSSTQIYKGLDACLYPNFLNTDHALFTRNEPQRIANKLEQHNIASIACAYIIINELPTGSSTLKVTNSEAFHPINDKQEILERIGMAWHFGQRHLYLEAGSGSLNSVDITLIGEIKNLFNFIIIIGGGITTKQQVFEYHTAGADAVIVGTAVEKNPNLLKEL